MYARPRPLVVLTLMMALGAGIGFYMLGREEAPGYEDLNQAALVADGQAVYQAHCASCHGVNLEGQVNWQIRNEDGRLPAPPHDATGHTWHHPDQLLFDLIKQGPAALIGNGYESDMQGFDGILSDDEIWAVLAYLKAQWPEDIRARHDAINAQVPP